MSDKLSLALLDPTGSTAGQIAASTGPTSAPAWEAPSALGVAASGANTDITSLAGQTTVPAAGKIGEILNATGSAVPMTTSTAVNLCSLTLTPGNWRVFGSVGLLSTVGHTQAAALINTVTGVLNTPPNRTLVIPASTSTEFSAPVPEQHMTVTVATPVYLTARQIFASGTATGSGSISAQRIS